ncbi:hypothetical protein CQA78_30995, partial [Klebsiella pneumoniae]
FTFTKAIDDDKTKADKYPQRVRNELRFRELTVLKFRYISFTFTKAIDDDKTKADKYPQRVRNELRFRELTVL